MRLSWNEVRVRAADFARKWSEATYESGETQSFYNDFFRVFGVRRRSVARYEHHVAKLDNRAGFIELFQVLDTPESKRHVTRDQDPLRFPYVNRPLFDGPISTAQQSFPGEPRAGQHP